jgi:hypothetical protein
MRWPVRIPAVVCRSGEERKSNAGCGAIAEEVWGGVIGPVHIAFGVVIDRHREASGEDVGVVALRKDSQLTSEDSPSSRYSGE